MNQYFDPSKSHHTREGFKNNYIDKAANKGFGDFLRWQYERRKLGLPKPPFHATAVHAPDVAAVKSYSNRIDAPPLLTWIGHATMLVQAGGLNTLTDPVFSKRASPVQFAGPRRAQSPGVTLDELPHIDVVLISHNHYDHLDKAAVQEISQRSAALGTPTLFIVPLGLEPWFADLGIGNVKELDWWDQHTHRGVEFNLTPVQHWSTRGLGDRNQTLWGGYAVFAPDLHWYFSGDSGYSRDFIDTAARFADRHGPAQGGGFDLALIAIGAYEPRWFMKDQHVNPQEAVQVHLDLKAKRSVGIHWGTFELTDESLDEPPRALATASRQASLKADEFSVMAVGETRTLPARRQL